jgi:hypothetical protein
MVTPRQLADALREKAGMLRDIVTNNPHPAPKQLSPKMRKPASERQLTYLRRLGCREIPANRYEASVLISTYKEATR